MEEKLIEAVKLHPCLFDKSSLLFRDKMLKEKAWKAASIATGASVEQCKQRWKSLRDRFVREVVLQQAKTDDAAEEKNEWCYFELMRFLTKHVNPRKTKFNPQWSIDDQPDYSNSAGSPQSDSYETTDYQWVESLQDESELNESQTSTEAPKTKKASKRKRLSVEAPEQSSSPCCNGETVFSNKEEPKNKAILAMLDELLQKKSEEVQESSGAHESFIRLCGIIERVVSAKEESKNKAFLTFLDELLQKKPEEMQESLKMEILNHVHNS
uniref:Transcription factor Adf-1 n=1 Tax=Bactrocera dorsalis TaxID=27457 RepID=A0A034W6W4_BACDO